MKKFRRARIPLLVLILACISVAALYFWQWRTAKNPATVKTVSSYEECVVNGANQVAQHNLAPPDPRWDTVQNSFECTDKQTSKKFYSRDYYRCAGETDCADIYKALNEYCNNEYISLRTGNTSGTFKLRGLEVLKKDHYVRADIKCYKDSDVLKDVGVVPLFLKQDSGQWKFLYTPLRDAECLRVDGFHVPLAIAGMCYDSKLGGFRIAGAGTP